MLDEIRVENQRRVVDACELNHTFARVVSTALFDTNGQAEERKSGETVAGTGMLD
jgi:hypothetical protein